MNADGWKVVGPHRYAGETAGAIEPADVVGDYRYVNHGKAISATINRSQEIRLEQDGTMSGAVSGTWERDGENGVVITIDGDQYMGGFVRQWEAASESFVMTFSALSTEGVAIWGSKLPDRTDA